MLTLSPFLVLLKNMIFYATYPVKLTISLLHALPKKGDLSLMKNYRGIQMQPLLSLLYDRIITKRLTLWAKFNTEQSAFQKGKGTLDQIFLLRTVRPLAKNNKSPLYIGFYNLEKAFDITRVIIIIIIKLMYMVTKCVLKSDQKF